LAASHRFIANTSRPIRVVQQQMTARYIEQATFKLFHLIYGFVSGLYLYQRNTPRHNDGNDVLYYTYPQVFSSHILCCGHGHTRGYTSLQMSENDLESHQLRLAPAVQTS
jgi:hypothetical protein